MNNKEFKSLWNKVQFTRCLYAVVSAP